MPSERAVLENLSRNDLLVIAAAHDLVVKDRRVRAQLITAIRKLSLQDSLSSLPAASLKDLVAAFDLTPKSRKKEGLITALCAAATPAKKAAGSKAQATRKPPATSKVAQKIRAEAPSPKTKPAREAAAKSVAVPEKKAASTKAKAKRVAPVASGKGAKPAQKTAKKTAKPSAAKSSAAKQAPEPKAPAKKHSEQAADAAPEAPPKAKPGQMGSWAEAALAAARRGQSAATMLRPLAPPTPVHGAPRKCASCGEKLSLRKCSVQACAHQLLADSRQKICAECRFERNTLSMTDFEEVLGEERTCPHCDKSWRKGG